MNIVEKAMENKGIMGADIQKDVIVCSNISEVREMFEFRTDSYLKEYYKKAKHNLMVVNGDFESMNEEVEC